MWGIKLTLVIFFQIQAMLACNPAMTCDQKCSYMCKSPICMGIEQNSGDCEGCKAECIVVMTKDGQCGEEVQKMGRIMKESVKIFLNRMIDGLPNSSEEDSSEEGSSSSEEGSSSSEGM